MVIGLVVAAVAAGGCGSQCTEGRSVECTCPGGASGAQTCRPDGTWGACQCGGAERDSVGSTGDAGETDDAATDIGVADADTGPVDTGGPGAETGLDSGRGDTGREVDVGRDTGDAGNDTGSQDGWRSARARSRFEREVSPPACDESRSSVKVIDEDSDWDTINSGDYDTFCVKPGDYRGVANRIRLTTSGSKGDRRYIVYDGEAEAHPIDQSQSERAIVEGFRLESGASRWTISGLTVDTKDEESGRNAVMKVDDGATHNVFDRMLASGSDGEYVDRLVTQIRGDQTTVQNSVIRNVRNPGSDRNCIDVSDDRVTGTRIVSNELYDCTDSVQLVISSGVGLREYPDTLIAHNDLYHSTAFRTDGNGNFDEQGDWTCGENAIDIKGTGEKDAPIRVIGNRMWGYSDTDENCGGSGSGPFSKAMTIHQSGDARRGPDWVEVRNNVIFETATAITLAQTSHITIENNLFHSYGYRDGNGSKGYGVMAYITDDTEVTGNVFTGGRYWFKAYNDSSVTLADNAAVDAGESGTGSGSPTVSASGNAYYGDSTPWEDAPDIRRDEPGASNNDEYCVTLKAYTSPTERCFDHAVSTVNSPHGATVGFQKPGPSN